MGIFTTEQRRFAKCIGEMVYCNPFVPERIDYERQALGNDFAETPRVWSLLAGAESERANLAKLVERIEPLAEKLRDRLAGGAKASRDDLVLYGDLVLYMLYQRDRMALQQTIAEALEGRRSTGQIRYWKQFKRDFDRYLRIPRVTMPPMLLIAFLRAPVALIASFVEYPLYILASAKTWQSASTCVEPCVWIIKMSSAPPGPSPSMLRNIATCQFLWRVGQIGPSASSGIASGYTFPVVTSFAARRVFSGVM